MKTAKEWCQDAHFSQEEEHACCLDIIRAIQADALESAALVVLAGPFAGDRPGDAAAIRRLKPEVGK